jgi:hypothetical protein
MDETYIGREGSHDPSVWVFVSGVGWVRRTGDAKMRVLTLVERGGGSRSIQVDRLNAANVFDFLHLNADTNSTLNTDEAPTFGAPGRAFKAHRTVKHRDEEYVRRERDGSKTTTNTVEGFFGVFKRGMKGTYQHCGEKHLQRYLTEFDFRYSNRIALGIDDTKRTEIAIKGAAGKRLTYRRTRSAA